MSKQVQNKSAPPYNCLGGEAEEKNDYQSTGEASLSVAVVLGVISFFSLSGARPGIFVAPHLLLKGWPERDIGFALFVGGITTLVCQTPVGQLIDTMENKRIFILTANILIGLTSIVLVYDSSYIVVFISLILQGIGNSMSIPAIYGLTLGLVGHDYMVNQVPINETCNHAGNAFYAIFAGLLAFFTTGEGLFWVCAGMGVIGSFCLLTVPSNKIDHNRARGLMDQDGKTRSAPIPLWDLASDVRLIVLFSSVALFHLGNAAMLPLLSQQLSLQNEKQGIAFAAACIIVAQVSMVVSAASCSTLIPQFGTKKLFVAGFGCIPIRGAIVVFLLRVYPNPYVLLLTQVLDGIAGGIFGVTAVIVAEELTRGSGRFNLVVGFIKTTEALGASFSNLFGEMIAHYADYDTAFLFLCLVGVIPMVLYAKFMPDTSRPSGALDVSQRASQHGGKMDSSGNGIVMTSATNPISSADTLPHTL
mmetsp:Transcript_2566/g.2713  ORF Transcript_2566/g.2713 Transcript_2566/m.2713 type:complete len:475 (+) Transcript_2566:73-1497(+)|eukprot:CAMPEP_0182422078 /NCGR_PEP_ID=MMETSP1167-20130531/7673_1 /TAXON_ID=2988 /ORGANISM="Mallomonas Sp, Strain CCMP3275" /LENGTH=474 /DNA_ID=CAMNT_0024599821 /DNA_START=71 /DNA_END=1495 /DNA_ORIENTATION=+